MLEDEMEGQRDCIAYRSVFTISELKRVKQVPGDGSEELLDQPLQHLHHHWGEGHWSVVVERCGLRLLGHRDDGGDLEAAWSLTELERRFEDSGEDRGQLVSNSVSGWRKRHRQDQQPCGCSASRTTA